MNKLVSVLCFCCGNEYKTILEDRYNKYCCEKCNKEIEDNFAQLINLNNDQFTDAICRVISNNGCPVKEMSCSRCLKLALEKLLELQ